MSEPQEMLAPPSFFELARQAFSDTRRGYDLLAPKFEETPYATPIEWLRASLVRTDERYPLSAEETRGLDLACGTGRAVRMLRRSCEEVVGIDFSSGMLEQAQRFSRGYDGVSYRLCDLQELSIAPESFDRIVTFGAWGHILPSFRERLLHQIVGALRPGGTFVTRRACLWRETVLVLPSFRSGDPDTQPDLVRRISYVLPAEQHSSAHERIGAGVKGPARLSTQRRAVARI